MENRTEGVLGQLRGRYPGWDIWVVYRAAGGAIWCALRYGAHTREVINVDSADELARLLAETGEDPF